MDNVRDMMEQAFYSSLEGKVEKIVTEKKVVKTASIKDEEVKVKSHDVRDVMSDEFCRSLEVNIKQAGDSSEKVVKTASTEEKLPIRKVVK